MTTEAPDGPMPQCMHPNQFRAEIERRKAAERERDDLAKQAERLIEENEHLTDALRRSDEYRQRYFEESNALRANVATLVEQLGEAERRIGDEKASAARLSAALDEERRVSFALRLKAETYAEECAALKLAGAAQPVVEPRDETRMCCGEPMHFACLVCDNIGIQRAGYAPHPSGTANYDCFPGCSRDDLAAALVNVSRVILGAEGSMGVGANPCNLHLDLQRLLANRPRHPSGTEGPAKAALSQVNDIIIARDALKNPCATIARIEDVVDRALAASPPDGAAPERAAECPCCKDDPNYETTVSPDGRMSISMPREKPTRPPDGIITNEDLGIVTDIDGEQIWPTQRPPDGMPGEPARCGHRYTHTEVIAGQQRVTCLDCKEWMPVGTPVDAPPTVPGSSDEDIARRGHKAMAKAIAESRTPISPMVLMDAQNPPPRQPGRLISATPLGAAPPTVPGEPCSDKACDLVGTQHSGAHQCETIKGQPVRWGCGICGGNHAAVDHAPPTVPGEPCRVAGDGQHDPGLSPGTSTGVACTKCGDALPADHPMPTPPLTPERAPLRYEEPDPADEPGILIDEDQNEHAPFLVKLSGETYYHARKDAEQAQQEWALAIYHNVARSAGRAPLDEAAVRADERRRTELAVATMLRVAASTLRDPAGFSNDARAATLAFAAARIEASDYPRRSERAG